ncbi:hypothetical protein SAMN04489761_2138 [Tenacibaculum sp. MAR_2009_124]|uniref:hypothetical protein n=1 Tax=Tenacibaculum sp. MAR_2009_124 TaxID=1250059 RepID=UPI000896C4B2|nr:hypothetical protein [Tenacibaculum sp. MAR_2009_124]SEB97447.1 hypothetical protein SAMN04489761_2138 [Tenacibaculum sp. MAR_2009_124]
MKKKSKIASSSKEKEVLNKTLEDFNDDKLDLYKAIFGKRGPGSCAVVAVRGTAKRMSAYDKHDTFLQAAL